MTQEDKKLLLVDLCARLPYEVKFKVTETKTITLDSIGKINYGLIPVNISYKKPQFYLINEFGRIEYKPYLRPMSSMTEEEKLIYEYYKEGICNSGLASELIDWLNKNMFDYRGLIGKGLALEAPEGMYKEN